MLWTDEGLRTKEETLPLSEYPRPQLKRSSFLCLNGEWDFEISKSEDKPSHFSKKIRVYEPFYYNLNSLIYFMSFQYINH